ncbi:PilW family protein [Pseudomonas sp. MBLB4136]|uniref:PilW family protein n=1 Tax=Pseudomonas sp. MBLB4136 TaxID=3451558 RepID=UPI003F74CA9A
MNTTLHLRQKGLSLVELLIALALSLLLMGGVLQIFLSSKQTYSSNNALFRVQESGRFATSFLTYDIRNAGYKGECLGSPTNLLNETHSAYSPDLFDVSQGIKGWNDTSPSWVSNRVRGDVLVLKHAANASNVTASGNTPLNANTINLTGSSTIPQDSIVIIADGQGCDVFQTTNNANANSLTRGNVGTPGNKNPGASNFSHTYGPDMQILTLESATYYIGNGANGLPSLRRISYATGTASDQELVEGIEDMQILYGIADLNKQVSNYVTANNVTNWDNVAAVRIELLAVSADTNVVPENQVIAFNGANTTIANRRLAHTFSTTIGLRNRLP